MVICSTDSLLLKEIEDCLLCEILISKDTPKGQKKLLDSMYHLQLQNNADALQPTLFMRFDHK